MRRVKLAFTMLGRVFFPSHLTLLDLFHDEQRVELQITLVYKASRRKWKANSAREKELLPFLNLNYITGEGNLFTHSNGFDSVILTRWRLHAFYRARRAES